MLYLTWSAASFSKPITSQIPVGLEGVYIIIRTPPFGSNRVVRVGQGQIANRLAAHARDPDVLRYGSEETLFAWFASVSRGQRDGVERYLADVLSPLVGEAFPKVLPIAVNLPW